MLGLAPLGGAPLGASGAFTGVYSINLSPGVFVFTGTSDSEHDGKTLAGTPASIILTGGSVTITRQQVTGTPASYLFTMQANVQRARRMTAASATFAWSGATNAMAPAYQLATTPGGFNLNGVANSFTRHRGATLPVLGFSLALTSLKARITRRLNSGAGSFAVFGSAATFGLGYLLNTSPGSFAWSVPPQTLKDFRRLIPDVMNYAITLVQGYPQAKHGLPLSVGSFLLNSVTTTLARNRAIAATPGTYVLHGEGDALSAGTRTMVRVPGSFGLSGGVSVIMVNRGLLAEPGSFVLTEMPIHGVTGYRIMTLDPGVFILDPSAELAYNRRIAPAPGAFLLRSDGVVLSGQPTPLPGSRWGIEVFMNGERVYHRTPGQATILYDEGQ